MQKRKNCSLSWICFRRKRITLWMPPIRKQRISWKHWLTRRRRRKQRRRKRRKRLPLWRQKWMSCGCRQSRPPFRMNPNWRESAGKRRTPPIRGQKKPCRRSWIKPRRMQKKRRKRQGRHRQPLKRMKPHRRKRKKRC